ncbi:phosphoribosylanthranilate isomerase [Paenibacillus thailandensis]|uniref:N-(5'-phosphoribosyl)anthranilate isomerase n=1 Tax=Paenibacillus thailandensis TaxID=393250 RepID=A0ABW5R056_9BACL
MSAPRIKICGLKDAGTIRAMDGLPIHEIGFVFAPSKRQVTPETAASLIREVHALKGAGGERPLAAGVFVNAEFERLRELLAVAPLDIVQLHGEESPSLCRSIRSGLNVRVWKVFSVGESGDEAAERIRPYAGSVDAVLIDTAGGGTGKPFDWEQIEAYKAAARSIGVPLYVAGGLNPDNADRLVRDYAPDGIDVSSGVETEGQKDIHKIRLFVQKVVER